MPTNDFTGIDFNYRKAINSPPEMGMGTEGDKFIDGNGNLGSNFTNVLKYTGALFVNNSAIKSGGLGNRYFIETNKVCKNLDQTTDGSKNRFVLLDNRGYSKAGIIPSLMNNVSKLNPVTITKALIPENPLSSENDCVKVNVIEKLQDANGNLQRNDEQIYMTKKNIRDVNPCFFDRNEIKYDVDGNTNTSKTDEYQNPVTGETGKNCDETFSSMNPPIEEEIVEENNYSKMPDDKLSQLYLSTITILGLYVVLKFIHKR